MILLDGPQRVWYNTTMENCTVQLKCPACGDDAGYVEDLVLYDTDLEGVTIDGTERMTYMVVNCCSCFARLHIEQVVTVKMELSVCEN